MEIPFNKIKGSCGFSRGMLGLFIPSDVFMDENS